MEPSMEAPMLVNQEALYKSDKKHTNENRLQYIKYVKQRFKERNKFEKKLDKVREGQSKEREILWLEKLEATKKYFFQRLFHDS